MEYLEMQELTAHWKRFVKDEDAIWVWLLASKPESKASSHNAK
jgi:hypothetical protein